MKTTGHEEIRKLQSEVVKVRNLDDVRNKTEAEKRAEAEARADKRRQRHRRRRRRRVLESRMPSDTIRRPKDWSEREKRAAKALAKSHGLAGLTED